MMSANSELENHFNCTEVLFPFLQYPSLNLNISKSSISNSSVFRYNIIPVKTLSDQLPNFCFLAIRSNNTDWRADELTDI